MASEKRLINAYDVPRLFEKKYDETEQRILDGETYLDTLAEGFTEADDVILAMPTVDAVEVVHGRWITEYWKSGYIKRCSCSECGDRPRDAYNPDNYCPNCGAKMDGERKDND